MHDLNTSDWQLLDKDGNLLELVNCHYDSLDVAFIMYDANVLEVNMNRRTTKIIE